LLDVLKKNKCDAFTITNHNNARSCFEQQDRGIDILTGAEFSCWVPDFHVGIHVLTYGFDPAQEGKLNKLRKNLYDFLEYTVSHDLPTIWAHPLYHYSSNGLPPMSFFNKLCLVFERFEVLNGQRDTWQNMVVKNWIEGLTHDTLDQLAIEAGINARDFCKDPYRKIMSGGSDSHMGIYSGQTGTRLYVPDLQQQLRRVGRSELALQAIREGRMAPYGSHQNAERLTVAFLDYVCQIAMHYKDPGLLRIILHKGTTTDKFIAMAISNAFAEVQRHKVTMSFVRVFHNCFLGKKPGFLQNFIVPKAYKPVFDKAVNIADLHHEHGGGDASAYSSYISDIYGQLNTLLFDRLEIKLRQNASYTDDQPVNINKLISELELPSEIRTYLSASAKERKTGAPDLEKFLDGLSFPFFASSIILAAHFTSARVMYHAREMLRQFSLQTGKLKHPERMLWLTDTFDDKNGVSMVLQAIHQEVKQRRLPIDFLVCSDTLEPDDNLIVIKPVKSFRMPFYLDQTMRIPSFLEIHHLFREGEYDRLMCSTEGPMGLASIYLKQAYSVKASFYVHTDWLSFVKKVWDIDHHNVSRVRRMLRSFYDAFDRLFVLNKDHRKWLTGREMAFENEKIAMTAHWADHRFRSVTASKSHLFGVDNTKQVLLYAGRISKEKGILELPQIFREIAMKVPGIHMVVAGSGPDESMLKEIFPEAIYLGWVSPEELPGIYSASDLLVLPSKFDTFSCVTLESFSCGLPVIAYRTKGPKDIIEHKVNGFLAKTKSDIVHHATSYLQSVSSHQPFRIAAMKRAAKYQPVDIMDELLRNTGFTLR
jgi:glycosyltransferase involved in cell wall biosynthesis